MKRIRKHKHGKRKARLYTLYIFKNRQWQPIGTLCEICGVHINEELLKKAVTISESGLTCQFDEVYKIEKDD